MVQQVDRSDSEKRHTYFEKKAMKLCRRCQPSCFIEKEDGRRKIDQAYCLKGLFHWTRGNIYQNCLYTVK